MSLALFDLDRTLLPVNSGVLWLRRELALGHVSHLQAARAVYWLARYQLGFASVERAIEQAIALLAGTREEDLRARSIRFYEDLVRGNYRAGGLEALERHRDRGDRLALLTSSSVYLAEPVAEELGLEAVLCNRFEVDAEGRHTGRPLGRVCFGAGKLVHARSFAEQTGERLEDASFYTDSYSDLSVLEAVGRPVAVNPDWRLRGYARSRGWEVVDWGVRKWDAGLTPGRVRT